MILGVIADDFTGATDVASMLVRAGMRTVLMIGVPSAASEGVAAQADAIVVALKTRTAPAERAIEEALAALDWLRVAGARQCYFKICSTFDSTPRGNIGPVADALAERLGARLVPVCPAVPENGRSVYRGHLFVGDALVSESGMRQHPLTPMTDANLVRVLQAQTAGKVGLVRADVVAQGAAAIRARCAALQAGGVRLAIVDAISNEDLREIAAAAVDQPLIVAGAGVALGLPDAYAAHGWLLPDAHAAQVGGIAAPAAVLAGSCSAATLRQVAHWRAAGRPALRVDPHALAGEEAGEVVRSALVWAVRQSSAPLLYATASSDQVRAAQDALGGAHAGRLVEQCMAALAQGLYAAGVRRFVVAGGETSGAVVQALGVRMLRIGPAIDPGVPWTRATEPDLMLALKSGNFGADDFFAKALALNEPARADAATGTHASTREPQA